MRWTKARLAQLQDRLGAAYPDAHCALEHRDPYELVVATILSAQCTDVRVNLTTPALFARYPGPAALAAAEPMAPAALQLSARPSASGGPLLLLLELLLVLLDGWFALGELLAPWITNHLRPAKSRVGLRLVPLPELVRPGSLSAIHY